MQRRIQLLAAAAAFALSTIATAAVAQAPATRKPDLSGFWGGPNVGGSQGAGFDLIFPSRRCAPTQFECDARTNQSIDGEFTDRYDSPSRPLYKPEFWDRVQYLDMNTNKEDPLFKCQSYGIPRVGPPSRIIQMDKEVLIFYRAGAGAGTQPADYRTIWMDQPHDPVRAIDVTFYGDSVGKWEGDTLVIDTVGFNDETWLDKGGFFTSDQKRVIERLRREGDTLIYDVTVEDPGVLVEPWVMDTKRVPLNKDPKAFIPESPPCHDYDLENMVNQIRH